MSKHPAYCTYMGFGRRWRALFLLQVAISLVKNGPKKSGAFQLTFYSPKRRGQFRFKPEKLHTGYEKFCLSHVEENQEIFRLN